MSIRSCNWTSSQSMKLILFFHRCENMITVRFVIDNIEVILPCVSLRPPCQCLTLTTSSMPVPMHTNYWQQPSEGTKDATSRPSPKVGSWSTSRQRPPRLGQRLSSHWIVTANIAVKRRKYLSRKAMNSTTTAVAPL